jgi:hypothetical protein
MTERESTVQRDRQTLQEIFVSVTGETVITDRQHEETHKKVISLTESDSSADEQRFDAGPTANGLKDAIGDPQPE